MSWKNRLQEAVYESASGLRMKFEFEDVSFERNFRNNVVEYPLFSGAYVQKNLTGANSYPMKIFFSGENYDLEADEFIALLNETGDGLLEHPLYGRIENISVVGKLTREDRLVRGANQCIIQLLFVQSSLSEYPISTSDLNQVLIDLSLAADAVLADDFKKNIVINSSREAVSLADSLKQNLNVIKDNLKSAYSSVSELKQEFDRNFDALFNNINIFVSTPLALAYQIIDLVKLPAKSALRLGKMLEGYSNVIDNLTSQANGIFEPALGNLSNNAFFSAQLTANASLTAVFEASRLCALLTAQKSGAALDDFFQAVLSGNIFTTQAEIAQTIDFFDQKTEKVTAWAEDNQQSLEIYDSSEFSSYLNQIKSATSVYIIKSSFENRKEVQLTLPAATSFVPLAGRLYRKTDTAYDFLIQTNNLSGSEILELPAGRVISYYA